MLNIILLSSDSNGYWPFFLDLFLFISIICGIFIIISINPIVSVIFLITLFSAIACYLVLTGMVFLGISYLLVYVGAVSILFLFILMLINIRISELVNDTNNSIPLAIITIISIYVPLSNILPEINKSFDHVIYFVSSYNWDTKIVNFTDISSIGNVMYTNYALLLIVTSIILLLGMVGSIIITLKSKS